MPDEKICEAAGLSLEQFKSCFAQRQDLLDAIYITVKQKKSAEIIAEFEMGNDIKAFFYDVWRHYVEWAMKNKTCYIAMRALECSNVLSNDVQDLVDYCLVIVHDHFEEGICRNIFNCVSADFLTSTASAQVRAAVDYVLKNNTPDQDRADYIKSSFEMFWRGISKPETAVA